MVVGAVWFIFASVLFPIVAAIGGFVVGVDVVEALFVSSSGQIKKKKRQTER